jgi:UTP--glucose-1-phosphate uridylyltransferase
VCKGRAVSELRHGRLELELAKLADTLEGVEVQPERLRQFARDVAAGRLCVQANRLGRAPQPPRPDDVEHWDAFSPGERAQLMRRGRAAIEAGHVAVAVLNGGMATRFGGGVKGVVPVFGPRSFLEIKRAQARRLGPVPFVVMNSFATARATLEHLRLRGLEADSYCFVQSASLRLTPEGELFRDPEGRVSPYAPGHGDFGGALSASGTLDVLASRGVHTLALSNVDNLGPELDPLVIGYHMARGRPISTEIVASRASDAGGAPVRVDGRLQLVEGFRFPRDFDLAGLPYVNTNSLVFSLDLLRQDPPLRWYYVEKRALGRVAVQLERLVGEWTAFRDTSFLVVPRELPSARYLPVKTPADLAALRRVPALVERFSGMAPARVVRG